MVPEWLDADRAEWIIVAVLGVVLVAMYLVARLVRQVITKVLLFVLLGGLALSLWIQRTELEKCVQTCECSLYGEEIMVPDERRPARCGAEVG